VTPVDGAGLPLHQIPSAVQWADSELLERSQSLGLSDFMARNFASVSVNAAQNNPLQPDLQFRGFTASPLLGLSQGLAVYQNGARINEPLGDSVSWDLLPESAVSLMTLTGGANPVFGLNALGGALVIDTKDGFDLDGQRFRAYTGSHDRVVTILESGGNDGRFGYYASVHYFEEDGWRDESDSAALTLLGALSWRGAGSSLDLRYQYGDSERRGNGASPVGLLEIDRDAVFTAPDITENRLNMVSLEGKTELADELELSGNLFWRQNRTRSFNGDVSEFEVCEFPGGQQALLEIDGDEIERALGLDIDDICSGGVAGVANPGELDDLLEATATGAGLDPEDFEFEDLTGSVSGSGILEDEAINNISDRIQDSYGANFQLTFLQALAGRENQLALGVSFFQGDSDFESRGELSRLDPLSRTTTGLGVGSFVGELATDVRTTTRSWGLFFSDNLELAEGLWLNLGGRYNGTKVEISDQSRERPELNGDHDFGRFNPSVGLSWQAREELNIFASYAESSRAPTPIELSCNEAIASAFELRTGEDRYECRLPNAFLADPPLDQVVAKSSELGFRGAWGSVQYHLGLFHTISTDDILFQTTGRATGLFANVDETRRMGVETMFRGDWLGLDWSFSYSYVRATFEDGFLALSPNHPFADDDGRIQVSRGDRIPGIPEHQLKFGMDYQILDGPVVGAELLYYSDQTLRGDESNQLDTLDPYTLVNLRASWKFGPHVEFFARVDNVFDVAYESFGLLGESPSEVLPGLPDGRPIFLGPGAPRGAWIGVQLRR
ncbi:MAG: TonB-dependent receptor, partial [Gaiellaceae bacterium]